ncbi:MAG: arginine repressor [Candidatus Palauibacterales bacterium]|nr:arginine repressor [Candidatus Palauibacterales bacterium]MDP2530843.1 arginine repressor [Candidatus Palauibacterales bacterium]MDP2584509.1 arginine repressor [Candidatus Palauibacterales bacterium]
MNRRERERAILDIVAQEPIGTQSELVAALARRGIEVTQATVSRDIRRLGLVKVPSGDEGYRYALPDSLDDLSAPEAEEALRRTFEDFVLDVEPVRDIVVVHTEMGAANAVGVALDEARLAGVAATLAGDDTIFVLTRSELDRKRVLRRLREMAPG